MITFKNGKTIELPEIVLKTLRKADDVKGYAIAAGTGLATGLATNRVFKKKEKGIESDYENDYRNVGLLTDAKAQ